MTNEPIPVSDQQYPLPNGKWHFDKRLSIGHLITTCGVIFAMALYTVTVENRLNLTEERVATNARDITRLGDESKQQYSAILSRLNSIDSKADAHLLQHANGNRVR